MEFRPYNYPPDYDIARLHSQATQQGTEDTSKPMCPCCERLPRKPYQQWLTRSISQDLGREGDAFVVYFEMLKFYSATILTVILTFSVFMLYETYQHCQSEKLTNTVCIKGFGVWIVSFKDLTQLMQNIQNSSNQYNNELIILYVLRSCVFVFLLFINSYLLFKVQKHTLRRDDSRMEEYSLLIRNIDLAWKEHDLRQQIARRCPEVQIHELFFLHQTDRYKYFFDQRNTAYFKLKSLKDQKQIDSLMKNLEVLQSKLEKASCKLSNPTGKAIVMFTQIQHRNIVQKRFSDNIFYRILNVFGIHVRNHDMHSEDISSPEEIYWNYIGESSRKKVAMTVLEYIIIIVTLALSYVLLRGGLKVSDNKSVERQVSLSDELLVMGVAIGVVVLGICFRKLMCIIAEWRKPNTRTSKSLFIVSTSILFHLIYYAIIPTIYFTSYEEDKVSLKLLSIEVQVLFFLLIQFIISAFDVFFCFWNRRRQRILNYGVEGVCQKQLNTMLEYPGFPLELKLMLLFKSWTFVLFYAFEAPYVLFFVLILFVYLYVSDKHNLYTHYRKETISSRVEYTFLKIYSNFFTLFLCFLYCWSQYRSYEVIGALTLSAVAISFQIFYRPKTHAEIHQKPITQLQGSISYRFFYEKYLHQINSEDLDIQIKQFLHQNSDIFSSQKSINDHEQNLKKHQESLLISDSVVHLQEHLVRKY